MRLEDAEARTKEEINSDRVTSREKYGPPPIDLRNLQCGACGRAFSKSADLLAHLSEAHPEMYGAPK